MLAISKAFTRAGVTSVCRAICSNESASKRSLSRWSYFTVKRRSRLLSALGISSCTVIGTALITSYGFERLQISSVSAISNDDAQNNDKQARKQWNFIADVVDKAAPAVVYIEIHGRNPFTGMNAALSNGSGFIVREDGLILTNAHVVGNNKTVRVQLHDGRSFDGQVQAVDAVSDLATVRISAKNLPVLTLGNSSTLRTGEWVIAMGSPFRLSKTVTAGIISSTQRHSKELGLHGKDIDYIQTDANINFGNSGGPLISLDCEAIGINTMKVDSGISFAIPSNYAKKFLEKAATIEKRSSSRGWIGVPVRRYIGITMLSLTPDMIIELKSRQPNFPDVDQGVLIYRVASNSPAYRAGILEGDVVTQIDGVDMTSANDIYKTIAKADKLQLTILRRGFPAPLTITLEPEVVN